MSIDILYDIISVDLNTTATGIGTINSLFFVTLTISQIPWGIIIQKISPTIIMSITSLLFSITVTLFGLSKTVIYAGIICSIAGLFSGPNVIILLNLMENKWFNTEYVPFMVGIQSFVGYGLQFTFQILQAYIYETYNNWTIIFFSFSICALISSLIFTFYTISDYYSMKKTDKSNEMTLIKGEDNNGETYGSNETTTEGDINESNNDADTTWIKLKHTISNHLNWFLVIWGFCGLVIVNGFYGLWLINYMMIKYGFTRTQSSFINGIYFISRAIFAPLTGKLAIYYKKRKPFMICGCALWASTLVIIYGPNNLSPFIVCLLNILTAIGASVWGVWWCLAREYNDYYNNKDISSGFINCFSNTSGFISQYLIGYFIDYSWHNRGGNDFNADNDRNYIEKDYNLGFTIIPVSVVMSFIIALFLKETNAKCLDNRYYKNKTHK